MCFRPITTAMGVSIVDAAAALLNHAGTVTTFVDAPMTKVEAVTLSSVDAH